MTLTCQRGTILLFWGTQWLKLWNWIGANPEIIISAIYQDAFCQILYLYSYVWPHSDNIFEFILFQSQKVGFWSPEAKMPRFGSDQYFLAMAQCISKQKTSWKLDLAPGRLPGRPVGPTAMSGWHTQSSCTAFVIRSLEDKGGIKSPAVCRCQYMVPNRRAHLRLAFKGQKRQRFRVIHLIEFIQSNNFHIYSIF